MLKKNHIIFLYKCIFTTNILKKLSTFTFYRVGGMCRSVYKVFIYINLLLNIVRDCPITSFEVKSTSSVSDEK